MALKITTQIGTDRGITSEAYVRIAEYQLSKYGSANFRLELFQNQADAVATTVSGVIAPTQAHSQQIGESLHVSLTKEVEATRIVKKGVQVEVPAVLGEDGVTIVTPATTTWELQDVEETYTTSVPDLTPVQSGTIFAFAYSKLKEKLVTLYGANNVIDC